MLYFTFIISFISLFVRVIPEPVIDENLFLIFLLIKLSPSSTKVNLFECSAPIFFYSFAIELTDGISSLVGSNTSFERNSLRGINIDPPDSTILSN